MELALPVQRSVNCGVISDGAAHLKIKPFLGFFPNEKATQFSQHSWRGEFPLSGVSYRIVESAADFSKRRRRRVSTSGPKGRGPGGKTPWGTSAQKWDQRNTGENKDPRTPISNKYAGTGKKTIEAGTDKGSSSPTSSESDYGKKPLEMEVVPGESQAFESTEGKEVEKKADNGNVGADDIVTEIRKINFTAERDAGCAEVGTGLKEKIPFTAESDTGYAEVGTSLKEKVLGIYEGNASEGKKTIQFDKDRFEDASLEAKLEMEAKLHKKFLEELAEENLFRGNKIFYHPEVVKPDQDIEVFLNRTLSTLNNETEVMIMGACNDWRWKSFTIKLNKTHLQGDWWSCKVHIPKEAYKMDFVFFNGGNIYDNNNQNDFCIPVVSGMDAIAFEDFLLEEKRRELEKLAEEQAEKERQAEEQRRREAENAGREADRAQARVETERIREKLQHLMKNAAVSVDNVWFIKPRKFKGDDLVRLYYNKSSGPLAHANHIWIHGGCNNWKDGLSIVGSLIKDEKKEGD